uniref:Uncharacterized protein n=1 Tax=Dendroctonus ponderosae TaxID=77166 RepID=A0AAR5PNT9_DENPD
MLAGLGAPELAVPPLCPDVPLSFRSDGCEALSTAPTIQGLVQHSPSLQLEQACAVPSSSPGTPKQQRFPWQVLSESDESALRALEGALRRPKDARHLAQACESFSDELILDLPPEVFLQRPGIVCVLLGLLGSEGVGPQAGLVLRALTKLSRGLQARLSQLSDISLRSSKDEPPEADCVGQLPVEQFCAQGTALALTCLKEAAPAPRVSQACLLLVNELLQLLQLVGQELPGDCLVRLGDALEYFRLQSASLEHESHWRRIYLHLLCISAQRLPEQALPRSLQLALSNSLLDVGLAQLFPAVHQQLVRIVQQAKGGLQRFHNVGLLKEALSATVRLLRRPPSDAAQCLVLAQLALPSVALHRSPQFLQAFVDLCARQCLKGATGAVLALLANRSLEVRQHMYALCLEKGARAPPVPAHVGFLLDAQVFEEIALFGAEVGSHAQEILLYLLKGPVLAQPQGLLALVPALPVLLCHARNATPLGRTLMELTDPDTARVLGVPDDALSRANILLLFSKEAGVR